MKNVLIFIGRLMISFAVIYLFTAFVCWSFNPTQWSNDARFLCVSLSTMSGLVSGLIETLKTFE